MTGISNSSIQAWLDFRGDELPAAIAPCQDVLNYQGPISFVNCTRICNNTLSLLDHTLPKNLLTCGLWSSLTMLDYYNALMNSEPSDQVQALLQSFGQVGLDASNATYAYAARNAVSTCMGTLDEVTRVRSYQGDASFRGACSEQMLFPSLSLELSTNLSMPLQACVDAICSPRTLNPDLGGIGVSDPCLL